VEVLKREIQNIEKVGCYHYALISYFWHKKYVTDIFGVRMRRSVVVV